MPRRLCPWRPSTRALLHHIIDRLAHLEDIMADLNPALDRLEASVERVRGLVSTDVPALRAALDAERALTAQLVQAAQETAAAEDAEDVGQNQQIADLTTQRDEAVAETDEALSRIEGAASELDTFGAPGETPA